MGQHRSKMSPRELQDYLAGFDCRAARLLGRAPRTRAHTYAHIGRRPEMAQDGPKMGPRWPREALIKSEGGGSGPPGGSWAPCWAHLGPILGCLGPSSALLGASKGHLEANLGLRRAAVGMRCGQQVRLQKPLKTIGKSMFFGRFLRARSLGRACKVSVRRSCRGLGGLKRATWSPCWLEDGLERG